MNTVASRSRVDAALALLALSVGAASLTYPFSRDQGLFYYVGREWALRGALPYRDALEQKTPFIYALHALLVFFTGENTWAIRAAELACVALIGWCAAEAARGDGSTPREPGVIGAAMLGVSACYYGYFSFEDTANCELWCVLFILGSMVAVTRGHRVGVAFALGGVLFGLAILGKPPSLCFAPFVLYRIAQRVRSRGGARAHVVRGLGIFAASLALVVGVVVAYFAERGGLGAMIDVIFRANAYCTAREHLPYSQIMHSISVRIGWFLPVAHIVVIVCAGAIFRGWRRRDSALVKRYARVLLLVVAAFASVAMQLKFHPYHYAMMLVGFGLFCATLYEDLAISLRSVAATRALPFAYAGALLAIIALMVPPDVWRDHVVNAIRYRAQGRALQELHATFTSNATHVDIAGSENAGSWILAHSAATDTIVVRGYEPQIYASAQRDYAGRFFWSPWLTMPSREYRRAEWLAADLEALARTAPRFAVAYEAAIPGLDSVAWFEARGYLRRATFGLFVVLERAPAAGALSAR
jgi:hypothetical protein